MPKLAIISVILVLLVNLIVLVGVAYNRSEESITQLVLTERELTLPRAYASAKENSGMSLSLRWSVLTKNENNKLSYSRWGYPAWLTESKLISMGIDIQKLKSVKNRYNYSGSRASKEVIFVLEYDGPAYNQTLKQVTSDVEKLDSRLLSRPGDEKLVKNLENKRRQLKRLQMSDSRLFVIDAGLDRNSLMEQYNDKAKYLLLAGEVKPVWFGKRLTGRIKRLFVPKVHVSLPSSELILRLTADRPFYQYNTEPIDPRYEIKLNVGKRLEPWIESVRAL